MRNPSEIRFVSYNVLADIYTSQRMYPYCPFWALSWRYRKEIILHRLLSFDADILCLQEVQADHYRDWLEPELRRLGGYAGLYKQKSRGSQGSDVKRGNRPLKLGMSAVTNDGDSGGDKNSANAPDSDQHGSSSGAAGGTNAATSGSTNFDQQSNTNNNVESSSSSSTNKSRTADRVDGCALFYKLDRISLDEKYVIEFNDTASVMAKRGYFGTGQVGSRGDLGSYGRRSGVGSSTGVASKKLQGAISGYTPPPTNTVGMNPLTDAGVRKALRHLKKDNVTQIVVLTQKSTGKQFCVANTHLFWDPEYVDVKLWQSYVLIKELETFLTNRSQNGNSLPLVLCGDFNSLPESAVYELLFSGRVRDNHEHLTYDSHGILPDTASLNHSVPLVSAYANMLGSEPEFTNYTGHFTGTLDYVGFTRDKLKCVGALVMPTAKELRKYFDACCPNPQHPSDHLPQVFDFVWR
eukprot:g355.t1